MKLTSLRCTLVMLGCVAAVSVALAQQAAPPDTKVYPGKFYLVGMGTCPDLMTVRASKVCEKTDIFLLEEPGDAIAWKDIIGNRPIIYCPHAARVCYGLKPETLKDPAARAIAERNVRIRLDIIRQIADAAKEGKIVSSLQWGDPMVYGTTFYLELLPPTVQTEVVPGLGAFEAASAAVKYSPTFGGDTSGVILTMGDWAGRKDPNYKLMSTNSSMVFYTCGLKYPDTFAQLRKLYPADTPVAVVCYAGVPNQEAVIRSTVGKFMDEVDYKQLPYLNVILVGKFLKVGQARTDGLVTGKDLIGIIHGSGDDHSEAPPASNNPAINKPAATQAPAAKPAAAATGMRTECAGCDLEAAAKLKDK